MDDLLPLVAMWRGRGGLEMLEAERSVTARMRGYCGAAAVDATGTVLGVSCPRGGVTVFWELAGASVIATVELRDGCGLAAAGPPGAFLLTGGRGGVLRIELPERRILALPASFVAGARWDNHLALGRLAT